MKSWPPVQKVQLPFTPEMLLQAEQQAENMKTPDFTPVQCLIIFQMLVCDFIMYNCDYSDFGEIFCLWMGLWYPVLCWASQWLFILGPWLELVPSSHRLALTTVKMYSYCHGCLELLHGLFHYTDSYQAPETPGPNISLSRSLCLSFSFSLSLSLSLSLSVCYSRPTNSLICSLCDYQYLNFKQPK